MASIYKWQVLTVANGIAPTLVWSGIYKKSQLYVLGHDSWPSTYSCDFLYTAAYLVFVAHEDQICGCYTHTHTHTHTIEFGAVCHYTLDYICSFGCMYNNNTDRHLYTYNIKERITTTLTDLYNFYISLDNQHIHIWYQTLTELHVSP